MIARACAAAYYQFATAASTLCLSSRARERCAVVVLPVHFVRVLRNHDLRALLVSSRLLA